MGTTTSSTHCPPHLSAESKQPDFSFPRSFSETGTDDNLHYPSTPSAENEQSHVSFSESFFTIGTIGDIVHKAGLPIQYLRWIQAPTSADFAERSYRVAKLPPTNSIPYGLGDNSIPINPGIIEVIQSLPSAHLFGQALLLRDSNERTAMLSIAEAAFAQLGGLHELLELLVMMIEHTLRENDGKTQWQFNWQELKLEDAPVYKSAPPRTITHRTQHVSDISYQPNAQNTMPPFMETKTLHHIEDIEGSPVHAEIQAKIDKGFIQVDPEQGWECYRRNYFSVACSYSLKPFHHTNLENLRLRRCDDPMPRLYKIQAIAICISARVDGEHGKGFPLVQHRLKWEKGPISSLGRVKLMPRPLGSLGIDDSQTFDYEPGYASYAPTQQQSETIAIFDRIQFGKATANNGQRGAAQQYCHLLVELFAETLDRHSSGYEWVKFATSISAPIVVRGRSPRHYVTDLQTLTGGSEAANGIGVQGSSSVLNGRLGPIDVESLKAYGRHHSDQEGRETSEPRQSREYSSHSAVISIEKETAQWCVVIKSDYPYIRETAEIKKVLHWLELAVDGRSNAAPISRYFQIIDLEKENASVLTYNNGCDDRIGSGSGCWRQKIEGGKVLRLLPMPHQKKTAGDELLPHGTPAVHQNFPHPFPDQKDGLVLTAAALWSLFDNSVQRVPGCQCTFQSEGGDYIQCKDKDAQAFLWHVFSSDTLLCRGLRCTSNIKVALGPTENGHRLFTTSLCVLGWTAESRTTPEQPIASKFSVTSKFEKGHLIKYEQESLEAQAHLSVPAIVTPQLSFATTFSKRRYKVANSIEEDSITATNVASSRMVLIYCEARGLHLLMYGADLVEGICIELLKKLLCNGLPTFTHDNALSRLRTRQSTSFVSVTGNAIPGDELVRLATKRINKLIEATNSAARDLKGKLSYWVPEHLLCGRDSQALKAPNNHVHTSWHTVAYKSPPLILAVGEIDGRLIAREAGSLQCISTSAKNKTPNITALLTLRRKPSTVIRYGAVLGTKEVLTRWLHQIGIVFCGQIKDTTDRVRYGNEMFERTYRISEEIRGTASGIPASLGCLTCHHGAGVQCLYYVQ